MNDFRSLGRSPLAATPTQHQHFVNSTYAATVCIDDVLDAMRRFRLVPRQSSAHQKDVEFVG